MDTEQLETINVFQKYELPILFASLVPMFTGAAYLTGLAYYQTYLHIFHVAAALAPVSTADHFVYAYFAINILGQTIIKSMTVLVVIAALIFWAAFQWLMMESLSNKISESRFVVSVQSWYRQKQRIKAIIRMLIVPTAITMVIIYTVLFVTVILIIPITLGSTAGRMQAHEDVAAYRKGCGKPVGTRFCNVISESGKQLASGYIIGGSEKNIIVFDGTSTSILPRSDKTTISEIVEKAKQ